jgi:small subunit ribosomal protein S16
VQNLLEVTGDWQKFKGLPGTEGTLKPQPEKVDKRARFAQALAEANDEPSTAATTPKKKGGSPERVGKTADAAPAAAATKSDDVVDATKDADKPATESTES